MNESVRGALYKDALLVTIPGQSLCWSSQPAVSGTTLPASRFLGEGVSVGGWDPSLLSGASAAGISLLIFNCHVWVQDGLFRISASPTGLDVASSLHQLLELYSASLQVDCSILRL